MPQQQTAGNRELSRALYEELEALKIRIAFAEISEDEIDEFDRELASSLEAEYSEAAQERTLREIHRRLNRQLRKRFVRKSLSRTLNIAAAALLLFFIGLTTATATVHPVRLRLMEFIAQIEEHYSAASLDYNGNDNATVPAGWNGEYYPFYIPGEFKLIFFDDLFNLVSYAAEGNRVLEFSELSDENYLSLDMEGEDVFDISINENTGIAKADDESVSIVWGIEDTIFNLYFSGDLDEAQRIAESVQHIP